ncbi:MAG: VIT1/CCC1 transporter family protein [Chlamydiales bacterium]|nr:VIT1/CCC1 transporter family protein [Chlamydiales bacterium]
MCKQDCHGDHFKGRSAALHLKEARQKGFNATEAAHGLEAPGHIIAGADSAKQTAIIALLFWIVFTGCEYSLKQRTLMLGLAFFGWIIWKVCRSAMIGWSRLEKLHRVILEERNEIETNREQEKIELKEMYKAKGLQGKLLDDVVEVLMADDNRLLNVMLEEELGLNLASYEHPLKQAFGAFLGIISASVVILLLAFFLQTIGMIIAAITISLISSWMIANTEKNNKLHMIVWDLAVLFTSLLATFFLTKAVY